MEVLDYQIWECRSGNIIANGLLMQAESDLQTVLRQKVVQRTLIKTATSKLRVGNERKRKFKENLSELEKKTKNQFLQIKKAIHKTHIL